MPQALVGTGGFLAAVLWMDLMFDVQALGYNGVLPEDVLASIAAHYGRVTTAAPMANVISLVMLLTVLGVVLQVSRTSVALWLRVSALVTAVGPVVLAFTWVVPAALRLGVQGDPPGLQSELVQRVLWGNLICFGSVLVFVGLQILVVARLARAARTLPA